ncbi:MAG: alkaline phosphatase family protein [Burkholderiaceae bacterium]
MATKNAASTASAPLVDPHLANLSKIEHLVILMMENRSFDHMLGYLTLAGRTDVDGLDSSMFNMYTATSGGAPVRVGVEPMVSTGMQGFNDPCHRGECVDQQIAGSNGGFVQNYHDEYPADDPSIVMRYFQAKDLPVYDFLAREFAISDRWFSPVLGETWPNRLYAATGRAAGSRNNKKIPLYANKSFVRHLDKAGVSWKGYGDQTHYTIKLSDDNYRSSPNFEPLSGFHDNFGFIHDALNGTLPSVSIIDPHFFKNDDHPTADVGLGQSLVARIYSAIANGPRDQWDKTLLVILYDEHGGFFDHVSPGPAVDDDPVNFGSYGVRVPAFFIGGHVDRTQCFKTVCDHTSLIKTILLRFCQTGGKIPNMGKRVENAAHLGEVLSRVVPRQPPVLPAEVIESLAKVQAKAFVASFKQDTKLPSNDQQNLIAAIRQNHKAMQTAAQKTNNAGKSTSKEKARTGTVTPKAAKVKKTTKGKS